MVTDCARCRTLSAAGNTTRQQHSIITLLDTPGFQNPATCGRRGGATFTDLCQNYVQERLHRLYRQSAITSFTRLCMKVSFRVVLKMNCVYQNNQFTVVGQLNDVFVVSVCSVHYAIITLNVLVTVKNYTTVGA